MHIDGSHKTILLLEPEVLVRMIIAQYLRECGFYVVEGIKASDFYDFVQTGRPVHIVLINVELEGATNGVQLSRGVRQSFPEIDVILTAETTDTTEPAHALREDGPIKKPYRPETIEARIAGLLEDRRLLNLSLKAV